MSAPVVLIIAQQQYAHVGNYSLFRHAASVSAAQTQSLLPPKVLVQKTLTGTLATHRFLWTGVTDFRVERTHLKTVRHRFGFSEREIKEHRLNPKEIDPLREYGMLPGMVSPFLSPSRLVHLKAVLLLPWKAQYEAEGYRVALSLSLYESLLVPVTALRGILRAYAQTVYPSVPLIELTR